MKLDALYSMLIIFSIFLNPLLFNDVWADQQEKKPPKKKEVYIGFASMNFVNEVAHIKRKDQRRFKRLAKYSFDMKLPLARKILSELQRTDIGPKILIEPETEMKILYGNKDAVDKFHQKLATDLDVHLENVCKKNNAVLIVYDEIDQFTAEEFIEDKDKNMLIMAIKVFYRESNSHGLSYLKLNEEKFDNLAMFRNVVEGKVMHAVKQAVKNYSPATPTSETQKESKDDNSFF